MNHRTTRELAVVAAISAMLSVGLVPASAQADGASATAKGRAILEASGVSGGLLVHVGCGEGRLTAALGAQGAYLVQGIDTDQKKISSAREFVLSHRGRSKVSLRRFDGRRLPYADNLVNLLLVGDGASVDQSEMLRVLCPGGVGLWLNPDGSIEANRKLLKPWPEAIDDWSHWRHGADGNPVATDSVVGPPHHVQWISGPRWQVHHDMVPSFSAMVSSGGRIFYVVNEAAAGVRGLPDRWHVVARDAFNGVLLWKRPLEDWGWRQWSPGQMAARTDSPVNLGRRLVATADRLYVTMGFNAPVSALDARSGKTIRVYDETEHTTEIAYRDGTLLLAVAEGQLGTPEKSTKLPHPSRLMAVEATSGKVLWQAGPYAGISGKRASNQPIGRVALTVGRERVFFVDGEELVALDLASGKECWCAPRPKHPEIELWTRYHQPLHLCAVVYQDDVVVLAQPKMSKGHVPYTALGCEVVAFRADTGEQLWQRDCYHWAYGLPPDVFVIDGLVWVHDANPHAMMGLDLRTGQEERRFATTEAMHMTHHHRCYRDKATERFILTARRGTEFLDVANGENILNHWVRGTCLLGILPANGLLYAPPHPCVCYLTAQVNGLCAFASEDQDAKAKPPGAKSTDAPHDHLERGPAYRSLPGISNENGASGKDAAENQAETSAMGGEAGRTSPTKANDDWPTYRHDALRSGRTSCEVPAEIEQQWAAQFPGTPTSPVVSNGKVFVAATDPPCVYCLDAGSGERLWHGATGAKIDTPPTIYRGLVLFGLADGWVYCLRAADGALAWRFRAAPSDRQMIDRGELSSAWPVHGSVLVANDVVYACAGRSSFIDGGVYVFALDPMTGRVLQRERIYSPEPETGRMVRTELPYDLPPNRPGAVNDILLTDGHDVFLRHLRFNSNDITQHALAGGAGIIEKAQRYIKTRKDPRDRYYIGQHPGSGGQLLANSGLLDDTWYNQNYWSIDGMGHSRLLVFDNDRIWAVRAFKNTRRHARDTFVPGKKGYQLVALDRKTGKPIWSRRLPVRIRAMVVAGRRLFAAGPPDVVPKNDPWAAFDGRQGAKLCVFGADDGQPLAEYPLKAMPVHDGLIAAGGRLLLASREGDVVCFGSNSGANRPAD